MSSRERKQESEILSKSSSCTDFGTLNCVVKSNNKIPTFVKKKKKKCNTWIYSGLILSLRGGFLFALLKFIT